jgi:hypothetical protein
MIVMRRQKSTLQKRRKTLKLNDFRSKFKSYWTQRLMQFPLTQKVCPILDPLGNSLKLRMKQRSIRKESRV